MSFKYLVLKYGTNIFYNTNDVITKDKFYIGKYKIREDFNRFLRFIESKPLHVISLNNIQPDSKINIKDEIYYLYEHKLIDNKTELYDSLLFKDVFKSDISIKTHDIDKDYHNYPRSGVSKVNDKVFKGCIIQEHIKDELMQENRLENPKYTHKISILNCNLSLLDKNKVIISSDKTYKIVKVYPTISYKELICLHCVEVSNGR